MVVNTEKKAKIARLLYEFMGYCSARYNISEEIALTKEDVKIVRRYTRKLSNA